MYPTEYYVKYYVIPVILVGLVVYLLLRRKYPEVINHWCLYFTDRQFSTQEFYQSVERILTERKAPELSFTKIELLEKGILSHRREYFRVRHNDYTFDICAAPYGTGYFTSWWFGEEIPLLTRFLYLIPFLGWYLKRKRARVTYHIADTQSVFQAAVHRAVLDTIEQLSTGKGLRALSDVEMQPSGVRK